MGARPNSTHEGKKDKKVIIKWIIYYDTVKTEIIF